MATERTDVSPIGYICQDLLGAQQGLRMLVEVIQHAREPVGVPPCKQVTPKTIDAYWVALEVGMKQVNRYFNELAEERRQLRKESGG